MGSAKLNGTTTHFALNLLCKGTILPVHEQQRLSATVTLHMFDMTNKDYVVAARVRVANGTLEDCDRSGEYRAIELPKLIGDPAPLLRRSTREPYGKVLLGRAEHIYREMFRTKEVAERERMLAQAKRHQWWIE